MIPTPASIVDLIAGLLLALASLLALRCYQRDWADYDEERGLTPPPQ